MDNKKFTHAEEMLEQIFYYMSQLMDNKGFSGTILLLTDLGRTLVHSERASFWYWDREKKQYWTLAALGSDRIVVPEGTGIIGAAIENNQTIVMNDPYHDARFNAEIDKETGYRTKSILCQPVTNTHGEVIGAYQAINKISDDGQSAFDEQDVKYLTLAAVFCGKTLESDLLYKETQIDIMTNLKNRRGFYEYYGDVLKPQLAKKKVAMVMCDIDFFKKVNDTYGHNAGDYVLIQVAQILKNEILEMGEAFRWGGEEFILVIPDFDEKKAKDLAENIRLKIQETEFRFETKSIHITMSFGVVDFINEESFQENIERVDTRLYKAKSLGRNCVIASREVIS